MQIRSLIPTLTNNKWSLWALLTLMYLTFLFFRVPIAFDNFWGEDGSVFYNGIINDGVLKSVFTLTAGYYLLIDWLVAIPISVLPVEVATVGNAILVAVIIGLIYTKIFSLLKIFVEDVYSRFVLVLLMMYMPIACFDSIGAATGLHFVLNTASMFIYARTLSGRKLSASDKFVLILSLLSGPLSLYCLSIFILFISRSKQPLVKIWNSFNFVIIAAVLQIGYIVFGVLNRSRGLGDESSITKTLYLFLERVIGFNMVPGWSSVDSSTAKELGFNSLLSRAIFLLLIISFFLFLYASNYRFTPKPMIRPELYVFVTSLIYWFVSGYLFNPEPRYAFLPACGFIILFFRTAGLYLSRLSLSSKSKGKLRVLSISRGLLLCLPIAIVFFNSFPSNLRTEGDSLRIQLEHNIDNCRDGNADTLISIVVRPARNNATVELRCEWINSNSLRHKGSFVFQE